MIQQETVAEMVTRHIQVAVCDLCRKRIDPGPIADGKFKAPSAYAVIQFHETAAGRSDSNAQRVDVCRACLKSLGIADALHIKTELTR